MELFILLIVIVGIAGWWIWREGKHEEAGHPLESITKKMDVNHDGKVDVKDVVAVVTEVKETVVKAADVNKDGQVDIEDAKVVVEATKKVVKKTKAKAEAVVTKVKKPRSKKS